MIARPTSSDDAAHVQEICQHLGVEFVRHDVVVAPGPNFESRARSARRRVMPRTVMTGHTMDDVVETILLNMLRGAGIEGLTPMIGDPTKPLRDIRRNDLHFYLSRSALQPLYDESNEDMDFRRNRVRHELLAVLDEVAGRDVVPILARQAALMFEEREWLHEVSAPDLALRLVDADCRELATWPNARLRRWLRAQLTHPDLGDGTHPPSADEVHRAIAVVRGEVVATELSGGRRLSRSAQRLTLQ
ncbi:MAG: hypothetical protein HIU84_11525 [Acidobacteria bacterium]|nr:hypothetical protein [Acidobacteriota bacterium]